MAELSRPPERSGCLLRYLRFCILRKRHKPKEIRIIASDLREELNGYENTLKLFSGLSELLVEIETEADVDIDSVQRSVLESESEEIQEILKTTGFRFDGAAEACIKAYITEVASELNLSFEIGQRCVDTTSQNRKAVVLTLKGDGIFDTSTKTVNRLRVSTLRFRYTEADGEEKNRSSLRLQARIEAGPKKLRHTIKLPVELREDA